MTGEDLSSGAIVSGVVCLVAAILAAAIARDRRRRKEAGVPALTLVAAFLIFLAADEALALDALLEGRAGIGWERLYLPVVAAGGLACLASLPRVATRRSAGVLFAGGGLAWLLAEAAWIVAWSTVRGPMELPGPALSLVRIIPAELVAVAVWEEWLELGGSVLLASGLAAALATSARRPLPSEAPGAASGS